MALPQAALVSFDHELGGKPTSIEAYLKCSVAFLEWSVGDLIQIKTNNANGSATTYGILIEVVDDTSVKSRAVEIAMVRETGGNATLLDTSFTMVYHCSRARQLQDVANLTSGADTTKNLYLRGHGFTGTDKVDLWVW